MSERMRLPNRRSSELINFESMGLRFTASVSRSRDRRSVCELRVKLLPCGRGLGPYPAVIEPKGAVLLRCIKCGYIAPYPLTVKTDVV